MIAPVHSQARVLKLLCLLLFCQWATIAPAYQVWLGTHCTPANAAIYPNIWSNTAARVDGFDANPTPCLPTAGNPDQSDTSCSVAQYSAVYGAYACQNLASNLYCELARSQISSNSADFYASMTNQVEARFSQAATYGYTFGSIMIYDAASPYIWATNEMQQVRAYLDGTGRTNVGLMFDARNNQLNVQQRIALPVINDVVLEAGASLWFANAGNRTTLLQWIWTNSAMANKRIIFQIVVDGVTNCYSPTNNFMYTRQLVQWLGSSVMGYDFLRSPRVAFMPVTYNGPTLTYIPETAAPNLYSNTVTSVALSLIEQRAFFEGRMGALPAVADAYSFARAPYPTLSPLANQTVNLNTSSAALPFTLGSPATAPAGLAVSAYSSNPYLAPDTNIVVKTWSSTDLGSVGVAGSNTLGDVISLSASGADISGTADAGRFVWQPLAADGAMVARVINLQPVNAWSKAGVMIRASTNAGSVNCFLHVSASNGVEFTWRQLNNGATSNKVIAGVTAPCWVQLVKTGTNFAGYYALDNAGAPGAWTQVGTTVGISGMSSNCLSGLAATSHNNTSNGLAIFDNISGNTNRTVIVTPLPNQAGTAVIHLVLSDGYYSTNTAFTLTVPTPGGNTAPTISLATNAMNLYANQPTTIAFTVGDAQTPSGSLGVTGISENTNLVPNANLVFGGSGANRTVTITPATNQTGTTSLNLGVSDGTNSAGYTLFLTVLPPRDIFQALTTGAINDTNTWGVPLPLPGDTNVWQTGVFQINQAASVETFNGGTFDIQTGGEFAPNKPTATLTLNNLVLDGGTIYMGNNSGLIINLSGKTFTLNSGTLQASSANTNNRTITFQNGSLAGSGAIDVTGTQTTGAFVAFQSSINTVGFTGTFNVHDYGIFKLSAITSANASFGLNLSGTGLYYNNTAVALTSLVINGTNIPPGTYTYASFPPAQQSFIGNNGGTLTVVNSAPALAPVPDQQIIAGQTLTLANPATDPNVPPQSLTYSLLSPPAGATINPTNGVLTWRPTIAQAPGFYPVTVKVADNGSPSLSDTNSFNVTVAAPATPVLSSVVVTNGRFVFTVNGDSGPDYIFQAATNLNPPVTWLRLLTNPAATLPLTFTNLTTNFNQRYYRVLLGP